MITGYGSVGASPIFHQVGLLIHPYIHFSGQIRPFFTMDTFNHKQSLEHSETRSISTNVWVHPCVYQSFNLFTFQFYRNCDITGHWSNARFRYHHPWNITDIGKLFIQVWTHWFLMAYLASTKTLHRSQLQLSQMFLFVSPVSHPYSYPLLAVRLSCERKSCPLLSSSKTPRFSPSPSCHKYIRQLAGLLSRRWIMLLNSGLQFRTQHSQKLFQDDSLCKLLHCLFCRFHPLIE